ncbi:hypothetical protein P7C71_g1687, partial [Lecanoromycetidae sp. Uapishka_2]
MKTMTTRKSIKAKITKVVTENVVKYAKEKMTEPKKKKKQGDDKDQDEATKKKEKEEKKKKNKRKRAAWLKKKLKAAASKAIDNEKKWDDAFGFDWLDVSEAVPSPSFNCKLLTNNKLQEVSFSARLDVDKLLPDKPEAPEPGSEGKDDAPAEREGPNVETRSKGKRTLELADSVMGGQGPVKKARKGDEHQEEDEDEVFFEGAFEDSDDDDSAESPAQTEEPALVIAMHAEWITPVTSEPIVVNGQIRGKDSFIRGTLKKITFNELRKLYAEAFGGDLDKSPVDISAETLVVKISQKGLKLSGELVIDGKKCFKGMIRISPSKLEVVADVPSWPFSQYENINIISGSLRLVIKTPIYNGSWTGGFSIQGVVEIYNMSFTSTFSILHLDKDEWGFVLSGKAETDLCLNEIIDEVRDTYFDFIISNVALVASTIKLGAKEPLNIHGFPIEKGVFLLTSFEKIPFIEEIPATASKPGPKKTSTVKKPLKSTTTDQDVSESVSTKPDPCYLAIGITPGLQVTVKIYFPGNITFTIPQGANRKTVTSVKDFTFALSIGLKGVSGAFSGTLALKLDDEKAINFILSIAVNAMQGEFAIETDATIENPLGLSKRLILGPLTQQDKKLGMACQWVWGSPMPTGGGISGTLSIDKKRKYQMMLNADPNDFGLFKAMPPPVADFSWEDLQLYASAGGTFGSETNTPGFAMKGTLVFQKNRAKFEAKISASGLHLEARIPEFQAGPLKIVGAETDAKYPGEKYALASLKVGATEQSMKLKGKIYLFDAWAESDTHIEYKPKQTFKVNFDLQWNEIINLKIHATMKDGKATSRPEDASFDLTCSFEQNATQMIIDAIDAAVKELPNFVDEGEKAAQKLVDELEKMKNAAIKDALEDLAVKEAALKAERDRIEEQMRLNKLKNEAALKPKHQELLQKKESETARLAIEQALADQKRSEANSTCDQKKRVKMSRKNELETTKNEAQNEEAAAKTSLLTEKRQILNEIFNKVKPYTEVLTYLQDDGSENGPRQNFDEFNKSLDSVIRDIEKTKDDAISKIDSVFYQANKLATDSINAVQREITNIQTKFDNLLESLELDLQSLANSALQQAVTLAKKNLEYAKNDSATLMAKRTTLAEAKKLGSTVIARIQEKLVPKGTRFNLTKATLTGMITAQMTELPPFDLYIEGTIGSVKLQHTWKWKPWTPGKDSNSLFAEIGPVIVKVLKDAL